MSVPAGIGNYPSGVTDNDPHFDSDPDAVPFECKECEDEGCPACIKDYDPTPWCLYHGRRENCDCEKWQDPYD